MQSLRRFTSCLRNRGKHFYIITRSFELHMDLFRKWALFSQVSPITRSRIKADAKFTYLTIFR